MNTLTFSMAAADRDGVCLAQTTAGAGDLVIAGALASGGVATLDVARHISIYCAANMSAVDFTLTGTDRNGTAISEVVTGPNATTVTSTKNYKTITQVAVDAAVGTNTEVGSADEAETSWIPLEPRGGKVGVQVWYDATGALTYALQSTMDDVQANQESDVAYFADATITGKTASISGSVDVPYTAVRFAITSHTATGFTAKIVQRN